MRFHEGKLKHLTRFLVLILGIMIVMKFVPMRTYAASKFDVAVKIASKTQTKTVSVTKGNSIQIVTTDAGKTVAKKNLKYSSDNKAVATVSNKGVITTKKVGKAKITVTSKNGKKKAVLTVKVVGSKVAVKSIKLSSKKLTLTKGKSAKLKWTIAPETASKQNVTWSSSNSKIAKVSKGKITAVKAGTATITAKVDGKKATCKVTVTETVIAVTGITLDKTSATLGKGDTLQLTETVTPAKATDKSVTWKSSNESVVTVSESGLVTAAGEGTATVTCTAKDGSGKSVTCSITVETATGQYGGVTWKLTQLSSAPTYSLEITGNGALPDRMIGVEGYVTPGWERYKSKIVKIVIGSGVTKIGYQLFSDYPNVKTLVLNEGLEEIGDEAFWGALGLEGELVIPASVTSIGKRAFASCNDNGNVRDTTKYNMTSIVFKPNSSLKKIGQEAFYDILSLSGSEISFPDSLEEIGQSAFTMYGDNSGFTKIHFGSNSRLKIIGDSAFYGHELLTSISTLPGTLEYLGSGWRESVNLNYIAYNGSHTKWSNLLTDSGCGTYAYTFYWGHLYYDETEGNTFVTFLE